MKPKRFLTALAALLFLAAALSGCSLGGTRPFQSLEASEIASAAVELSPPGVTVEIAVERRGELAALLREAVIYQEDGSFSEYDGQGVCFSIQKTDGTRFTVTAYNPFLIVDGTGYRTEYQPCEALNRFANSLLED